LNPDARVFHLESQHFRLRSVNRPNADGSLLGELDRIIDEILQNVFELCGVRFDK
jgi:hypothetical protein